MTTTETTTTMDRFYELMDAITGGPTSEASLSACDLYAAALARAEAAEAEAARIEHARLYYQERTAIVTAAWDAERANNKAAWQRVAELEAAARWHRGYPTEAGDYVVRRADSTINEARYYTDGHHWGALNADIVRWAYMPQEPTP